MQSSFRRPTWSTTVKPQWFTHMSADVGRNIHDLPAPETVRRFTKDSTDSLHHAVLALNGGHLICDEGFCVIFVKSVGSYHLLWREDMEERVAETFLLVPAEAASSA